MEKDVEQGLKNINQFYDQQLQQKLDDSVNAILAFEEPIAVKTEEELSKLKYRLLNEKVGVLGGNAWNLVRAVKDGIEEPISCKVTYLSKISENLKKSMQTDGYKIINFLIKNQHKNLIKMFGLFVSEQKIYTFQELIANSLEAELIHHGKGLTENRTREVVKDVGNALIYLHTCGIAHRDINIQNVVVHKEQKLCKLTNFDYSVVCWNPQSKQVKLHACIQDRSLALFLAPEELEDKPYNAQFADIWSLAALIVYLLTTEYPPKSDFETFTSKRLSSVSAECINLLKCCFKTNTERPDIFQCVTHSWFRVFTHVH